MNATSERTLRSRTLPVDAHGSDALSRRHAMHGTTVSSWLGGHVDLTGNER